MNSTEIKQLAEAYIAEKAIERTRQYVVKGRRFLEFHGEDVLIACFVQAYRELVARDDDRCWDEIMDLQCEFDLRQLKAPIHLVAADFALFKARLERLQHVGPRDPIAPGRKSGPNCPSCAERLSQPKHQLHPSSRLKLKTRVIPSEARDLHCSLMDPSLRSG